MFGHVAAGELFVMILIWLIPLAITLWLLRAFARLVGGVQRIATALERIAATRTPGQ